MSLLNKLRSFTEDKRETGYVIVRVEIETPFVDGITFAGDPDHPNFTHTIPEGGLIKTWSKLHFRQEPLPIGTEMEIRMPGIFADCFVGEVITKKNTTPDRFGMVWDIKFHSAYVKVTSISRADGLYVQEVAPALKFRPQGRFIRDTWEDDWESLHDMLENMFIEYEGDPKFFQVTSPQLHDRPNRLDELQVAASQTVNAVVNTEREQKRLEQEREKELKYRAKVAGAKYVNQKK